MKLTFVPSERASLGIEWELQLVDLGTRELTGVASRVLDAIRPPGQDTHPKAKHELFECTVEVITGICQTVSEAMDDLRGTVEVVGAAAAEYNAGLLCAGTHPFSNWSQQRTSPSPRYAELVEELQWLAHRLTIFGVHVHVGVRSRDKVIPMVNALSRYVPHFLALSGSSPYWQGYDTGLASARSKIFETLPMAGLPDQFADWAAFESYVRALVATGAISTIRDVWWDIRPHPDFGTVEFRTCDGLPTYDEVAAVAALSQCLVERLDRQFDRGYTLPMPQGWLLRENKWRAARYGLSADIIDDARGTLVPLKRVISDLVEDLMPIAHGLGCAAELAGVERILAVGASASRQRAVAQAHDGDLTKVVDALLAEMRDGLSR